MKNKIIIFLVLCIAVLAGIGYRVMYTGQRQQLVLPETQKTITATVTVYIDDGITPVISQDIQAQTVYDALTRAAGTQKLSVKTKQYDFGIFVEQIGEYANTNEKVWIYYVNGKAGTVAADKQILTSEDLVEWKYEKPIY